MIRPRELLLHAEDNTALFVTDWLLDPPESATGSIVLMHGLGEHSGRYAHIVRFFNERGLSVRTYDHRGHGRSGGPRGDVPNDTAMLEDAKLVIDDFARQFSGRAALPFLFGHSMGGLCAARFATARLSPLRGLILSSPALSIPISGAQKLLLKVLSSFAPGLAVSSGLKTGFLSHDPTVKAAYQKDFLDHSKISARLLGCMLAAIDFTQSHAAALTIPVLMVVAGDDRLVDVAGSTGFFRQLAPGVGTMHLYDNFYHEVFNEVEAYRVFDDVHAWLYRIA